MKFEICHGTTRVVFLIGKWAVKVPTFTHWRLFLFGLLGNMRERDFSRAMPGPFLCPVVFAIWGGFLIVMKRARVLTRIEFEEIDLEAWCDRDTWRVPAEAKMDSFGWLEGRLVAVDYEGSWCFCSVKE